MGDGILEVAQGRGAFKFTQGHRPGSNAKLLEQAGQDNDQMISVTDSEASMSMPVYLTTR